LAEKQPAPLVHHLHGFRVSADYNLVNFTATNATKLGYRNTTNSTRIF